MSKQTKVKMYDHRTLYYAPVELQGWQWEKKLGFRLRVAQVLNLLTGVDSILFSNHNPLTQGRKDGYTKIVVAFDLIKEVK